MFSCLCTLFSLFLAAFKNSGLLFGSKWLSWWRDTAVHFGLVKHYNATCMAKVWTTEGLEKCFHVSKYHCDPLLLPFDHIWMEILLQNNKILLLGASLIKILSCSVRGWIEKCVHVSKYHCDPLLLPFDHIWMEILLQNNKILLLEASLIKILSWSVRGWITHASRFIWSLWGTLLIQSSVYICRCRIPNHSSTILKCLLKLLVDVTDSSVHLTREGVFTLFF